MPRLVELLRGSEDQELRLSALWAVKNLLRKTSSETKSGIMGCLGWRYLAECVPPSSLPFISFTSSPMNLYILIEGCWGTRMRVCRSRRITL